MEEFIASSLMFLLIAIIHILILWGLCWGTYRILTERSAPLKSRLLWAGLSVIPLLAFVLFPPVSDLPSKSTLLSILCIVCVNNFISWIFRRRMAAKERNG
jgi:hypothetical protein